MLIFLSLISNFREDDIFIFLFSIIGSMFLPDLFIGKFLHLLRNVNTDLWEYSKKYENRELRIFPKILGQAERMLFWIILYSSSSDFSPVITFFIAWIAIKTATNYKFWTDVKTEESHLGRALFCIYLIGNILSLVSVIFIFTLIGKL